MINNNLRASFIINLKSALSKRDFNGLFQQYVSMVNGKLLLFLKKIQGVAKLTYSKSGVL
jgi:hypothetical protein